MLCELQVHISPHLLEPAQLTLAQECMGGALPCSVKTIEGHTPLLAWLIDSQRTRNCQGLRGNTAVQEQAINFSLNILCHHLSPVNVQHRRGGGGTITFH